MFRHQNFHFDTRLHLIIVVLGLPSSPCIVKGLASQLASQEVLGLNPSGGKYFILDQMAKLVILVVKDQTNAPMLLSN